MQMFLIQEKKNLSPSCDSKMRTILEDPFTFLKTAILCGLSKYFGLVEMTGKLVPCLDMKPRFRIPQIHVFLFNIHFSYRFLFFSMPLHAICWSVNVSFSILSHLVFFSLVLLMSFTTTNQTTTWTLGVEYQPIGFSDVPVLTGTCHRALGNTFSSAKDKRSLPWTKQVKQMEGKSRGSYAWHLFKNWRGRLLEEVWNQKFPHTRNWKLFSKEISLRSNVKGRIIDPPEV